MGLTAKHGFTKLVIEAEPLKAAIRKAVESLRPPEALTLSQWADKYRRLSSEASAKTGKWEAWPFQVEPMDCMGPDSPYERVVLMCASQMFKTEAICNMLGYVIDIDPGPCLIVEPREADAETLSKDRVGPMLRDTPRLVGKVMEPKSRDAGNTILHKKFLGGHVTFVGSNAPAGLAMRPIRYLFLDETDRYPASAGNEGDPVMLAMKRTMTFWNRKIIEASTPTLEGLSRIAKSYELSDQRIYLVPCPYCKEEQMLRWPNVVWGEQEDGEIIPIEQARYKCEHCSALIRNQKKMEMLEGGRWQAQNPSSRIAGFWISQLYSPRRSWGDIAEEFVAAKGNSQLLQVFINTVLAETWKERGEAPAWEVLLGRCENTQLGVAPMRCLFLTAGVDVQKDRIEVKVKGWGRNKERWLLDYLILDGDTSRPSVWEELTKSLNRSYQHESGAELTILRMAIDSGYATSEVYSWARAQGRERVIVVKGETLGADILGAPRAVDLTNSGKRIKRSVRVWPVNVNIAKSEIYGFLRQSKPENWAEGDDFPLGWYHYPMPPQGEEYFKQLTAEEYVTVVDRKGFKRGDWVKTRPRNEALDTDVYALAAARHVGIARFTDRHWKQLETSLYREDLNAEAGYNEPVHEEPTPTKEEAPKVAPPPATARAVAPSRRAPKNWTARSSFLSR